MADSLLAIAAASVAEGYLLQRTVFEGETFRVVCLGAFGVNLVLKAFWSLVIYPFFVNPLRHLPQVQVIRTESVTRTQPRLTRTRVTSTMPKSSSMTREDVRLCTG